MEHAIINLSSFEVLHIFWNSVINTKDIVSKGWDHEELLQH
jgi:hypothetical protein